MHNARTGGSGRLAVLAACFLSLPLVVSALPAQAVTGTPEKDNARGFTARLAIGDGERACSGALVDAEWLVTAASCFADDPAQGLNVPAGKPALKTVATIGRTDLSTTKGQVRDVVELVPREDRDLVLARLSAPVQDVPTVAPATGAPSAGETLTATGYGRTKDEWAPRLLHAGAFTTKTADGSSLPVTGQDGASVCAGDTGGPLLREAGGKAELVAVNSRSAQGGCFGADETQTATDAVSVRVDDIASWITSQIKATKFTDFNCDGIEDIAVADPKATVGGDAEAGLVRVMYGGGKGTAEINQDVSFVPGGAEPGDQFGEALAVYDHNQDGCSDLVVGAPHEDLGGEADAGMVSIVHGSPDGLGKGAASTNFEQGKGSGALAAAASEAGDLMGFSLSAGQSAKGAPYLLIGAPGEDLGKATDAGNAYYVQGDKSIAINQNKADLPGAAETDDQFGYSVAGSAHHIAIGAPGEAIGTLTDSGSIQVLDHTLNSHGLPTPVKGIHQDVEGISGAAETGDEFGKALALTEYRPAGAATAGDSVLAVGSPGEGLTVNGTDRANAGRVVTIRLTADGGYSEMNDIQQEKPGVTGVAEKGDRFGETVAATNTSPKDVGSPDTMLLAVGLPGEAEGTVTGSGAVQKFSLLGAPGDNDRWIIPGNYGLPGTPGTNQHLGSALTATGTRLYLGMPDGPAPKGSVHAMPWGNVITGAESKAVTTYEPGKDGLPANGKAFGSAVQ